MLQRFGLWLCVRRCVSLLFGWKVHLCQLQFPFILHNEGGDRPADSRIAQCSLFKNTGERGSCPAPPKHKSMSDEWLFVKNPSTHVPTHYNTHAQPIMRTHSHLSLILVQWRMVRNAPMCMQFRQRGRMRERRESGVYLWLGRSTHRSPVQDHGHLGGLVDIAAERGAGPGAGVSVVLPSTAPTPQAWHGIDMRECSLWLAASPSLFMEETLC